MASWSVSAVTDDGHRLWFEWVDGPVDAPWEPGRLVARLRCEDPSLVRATPTGPFARPSLTGPSWVAYCTVLEAFAAVAAPGSLRSAGDPGLPTRPPLAGVVC